MTVRILGIAGSPRKKGNSEMLLDAALEGAAAAGADVEKIRVCDLDIGPCVECGGCEKEGICVIDDEMQGVYPKFLAADVVVIATPMFFMNVPSQLKAFIDRFQCIWARKYVLKQPVREGVARKPRGVVMAVGGTKGATLFQGLEQLMRVFFAIMEMEFDKENSMFLRSIDAKGDIGRHETALDDARKLGEKLAGGA